ncbi:unnamed protein product, partial [Pleuronectes platessa]
METCCEESPDEAAGRLTATGSAGGAIQDGGHWIPSVLLNGCAGRLGALEKKQYTTKTAQRNTNRGREWRMFTLQPFRDELMAEREQRLMEMMFNQHRPEEVGETFGHISPRACFPTNCSGRGKGLWLSAILCTHTFGSGRTGGNGVSIGSSRRLLRQTLFLERLLFFGRSVKESAETQAA